MLLISWVFQSHILLSAESYQILTNLGLGPPKHTAAELTFTLQNEKALLWTVFFQNKFNPWANFVLLRVWSYALPLACQVPFLLNGCYCFGFRDLADAGQSWWPARSHPQPEQQQGERGGDCVPAEAQGPGWQRAAENASGLQYLHGKVCSTRKEKPFR